MSRVGNCVDITKINRKKEVRLNQYKREYLSMATVELFLELSRTLSMSKTARAFGCSQPTVW